MGFLGSIFRRPQRQREIFRYFNGAREVGIDPLQAIRDLAEDPAFDIDKTPKLAVNPDLQIAKKHSAIMLAAVRRVFGLPVWSEDAIGNQRGVLDSEVYELYGRFGAYLGSLKKSTSLPPTSPDALEPEPSNPPIPPAMSDSLDSGLIDLEPKPAVPLEC